MFQSVLGVTPLLERATRSLISLPLSLSLSLGVPSSPGALPQLDALPPGGTAQCPLFLEMGSRPKDVKLTVAHANGNYSCAIKVRRRLRATASASLDRTVTLRLAAVKPRIQSRAVLTM